MRKLLLPIASTILMTLFSASSLAAPWQKGFVIEWYEPAFYYGSDEGISAPGTDCPAGTIPEMDWRKVLKTSYRSEQDVDTILDPENPQRARVGGIRGPNKENVYQLPWSIPDPGLQEVSGKQAYGFDLDGNKNNGFTGLNGEQGIDNTYYKAIGCLKAWRGPTKEGHHAKYVNDGMHNGRFTLLMLVTGAGKDWRNDNDVRIGFYLSKDKIVMDAMGKVAQDYTFRINPNPEFESVVAARTVNGVIETAKPAEVITRSLDGLPLIFNKGKFKFEIAENGDLHGFIGGYRSIDSYFREWAAGGAIFELTMHINIPAYWYALQRHADGDFDENTGRYTSISTAYRFYARPAMIVSPDATEALIAAALYEGETEEDPMARRFRGRYEAITPPQEILPAQIKTAPHTNKQALR